jgi:protein-L-isoaspartate(D-aspartate) O-methyltransferase
MTPQPDLFSADNDATANAKIQLLMQLRSLGIRNHAVLSALETVPRERFVGRMFEARAYENVTLPIAGGQTLESPYFLAKVLGAFNIRSRDMVLDVGTGSGYVAAVLSKLARRVFTLEHHRELRDEAQARLHTLHYRNVVSLVGDGHKGWKESAPYDRIYVSAAMRAVPTELLDQLTDNGILIAPVGQVGQPIRLLKITRDNWNYHTETLGEGEFDFMTLAK